MEEKQFALNDEARRAYEEMPVPFCVFRQEDGGFRLLAASDGLCRALGFEREPLRAAFDRDVASLFAEGEQAAARAVLTDAALHLGKSFRTECRLRRKNGDPVRFLWEGTAGRAAGAVIIYVNLFAEPADAGRAAEYRTLLDGTEVAVMKVRLDEDYTVEWCNRAADRLAGRGDGKAPRFSEGKLQDYYRGSETELNRLTKLLRKTVEKGEPGFEIILRAPQNRGSRWVKGVGTFGGRDAGTGRPAFFYAMFSEVTDVMKVQRRAQNAESKARRAESENEQLRRIIDNVPAGIGVSSMGVKNSQRVIINRYFAEMLGTDCTGSGDEALDRVMKLLYPGDFSRCAEDMHRFLTGGGALNGVYRFRREKTGDYFWVRMEGRMVREADGSGAAYLSYTDIDEMKRAETALLSSRRAYEAAVRAANISVWEYDIPGRRILLEDDEGSLEDRRTLDLPKVIEDVPQSLLRAINIKDHPAVLEMYRRVAEGQDASVELWTHPADPEGESRCFRVVYTAERDVSGRAVKAYGLRQDITAEKRVEAQYEQELANLRTTEAVNLIAKGRHNLTQNRVLEYVPMNRKAHRIPAGQTYDEACRTFAAMPYLQTDREKLAALMDRENLIRAYRTGETHFSFQYCREKDTRAPSWVTTVVNTYMAPSTGDIECFIYTYDVTEKLLKDQILSRLTKLGYDELGLIYPDSDQCTSYRVTAGEERAAEHTGSYSVVLEQRAAEGVPDGQRANFLRTLSAPEICENLRESETYDFSFPVVRNGRTRYKQIQFSWLDEKRNTVFYCLSDITRQTEEEQRQIRELQAAKLEADRANEAKSLFLSSMSHDLRTPLNGIIGFTDFALRETDEEKKQQYLEKVRASAALLLDLVNDTLELSRIESGKAVLEPETVDSRELGLAVAASLRPAAELKGVRLVTDPADFPVELIRVDRKKFQKVFLNLLSNSIKYTPAGGTIRASVQILDPPVGGCNRRITVRDTGIGISPEFLPHIFEPFSQEHRTKNVNTSGTGLGLAIVRRNVDLMGGTIRVESEPDRGTVFTVDLPVVPVSGGEAAPAAEQPPLPSLSGKHVLLCEDNYLNTEIATMLLHERGVTVACAKNGREGVETFAASAPGTFDAVLMDIRMPVMDGNEAARQIRALDRPDAASVPILAMTADAFEEDIRRAREAGMNGYVTKPVDPEKLFRELALRISRTK